jgi:hypothetical protein
LGAIVLTVLLGLGAAAWAEDDEAGEADTEEPAAQTDTDDDTEAPADEAVGKCVAKCEAEHDTCAAAAKAKADSCERQKRFCDAGCARCTRMKGGPNVVYCVNDCETCRAQIAKGPCGKPPAADGDCETALESCLERCGP